MLNGSHYLKENGNMKSISLFKYAGYAAIMSLTLSCVTDEQFESQIQSNSNLIGFSISSAISSDGSSLTKARHYADNALMMTGKSEEDTLYIHASSENNLSTVSSQVETRGIPVSSSNFAQVCKNFSVTGYLPGGRLYMNDVLVNNLSNGVWSPDQNHFWPENNIMMDFFAYAPATVDNNPLFTADDIQFITSDGKSLSFNYTVPGTGQEVTNAAEQQHDIMFAYKACSKSMTNQSGSVPLKFYHAFAGVKFVAKDIAAGTVKSITLKNLYGSGSCTYVFNENGEPSITWTFNGEQQTSAFHQEFNVKVENQQTGEQQITDKNHETTFMMLPQEIENAEVEVLFNDGEKEYTLVGKLYDPSITTTDNDTDLSTWDAGKIYTYAITTESINWEYVFDVTPSITLPLGTTTGQYTVTSYRQHKGDPSIKEAVAWKAENTGFSEKDQEDGTSVETTLDEILSDFTYQDENPSETKSYPLEVTTTTLRTTHSGDQTLTENTQRGSEDSPYDLSTHDENGGTIARTTANCYVVSAAGTYQLPLVYGNAIKNGSENSAAYQGGNFKDYLNRTISSSRITGADNAVLVWSDGFFMFKDIHLDAAKQNLVFTIDPDYMQQANAVLAVRDASNRIMWSWHIWVTERPVYTQRHTLQDLINGSNTYELMQCNLGWVDGKMVYYNQRDLTFRFTQAGSGKTATLEVTQEGAEFDYKDVGSTYYQWGRKDPLVALKNWKSYRYEDYRLHETGDPNYVYRYEAGPTDIGNAIQHPNVFYTRGTTGSADWNSDHITTLWNADADGGELESTTSVKTIYDPSPRGFKVPMPRAFAVWVNGNTGDGSTSSNKGELNGYVYDEDGVHNKYRVYPQANRGGNKIPLTATGQRADIGGKLEVYEKDDDPLMAEVGGLWSLYGVYYWTCVPINTTSAYTLVIRKDYPSGIEVYSYGFSGTKTMARPVRPIKEQ